MAGKIVSGKGNHNPEAAKATEVNNATEAKQATDLHGITPGNHHTPLVSLSFMLF
mgnify:CR=1 FL=1